MQVTKWGDDLVIRLPDEVVETLGLREGDEVDVRIAGARAVDIDAAANHERALKRIRQFRKPLPQGWRFDREDANRR